MGLARKLCTKKREAKYKHEEPSLKKEKIVEKGRRMGWIIGPLISYRNPLRGFAYGKQPRKAMGLRASRGYRNYYSWNWRKFLFSRKEQSSRFFGISEIKKTCSRYKDKTESSAKDRIESSKKTVKMDEKPKISATKHDILKFGISERKIENQKEKIRITDVKTERIEVKEPGGRQEKPVQDAEIKKPAKPKDVKVRVNETGCKIKTPENIVVKGIKAPRMKTGKKKIVLKSGHKGVKGDKIYKTIPITKPPRTSNATELHAEKNVGRRNDGKPANTSNLDFARAVPPFSLFSASVKLLKMKPEGPVKTIEVKLPAPRTAPKTAAPVKTEKEDSYHVLNRARQKFVLPKTTSAADSLN